MTAAFLGGILLGVVILLGLVVWSIRRHRDPDLHIECDSPSDELIPTLAGLTLGTAVAGNTATVWRTAPSFDVLIDRIHAARESVHFETFLWKEGTLGRRVAVAFIDRARAGGRCGYCWTPKAPGPPEGPSCGRCAGDRDPTEPMAQARLVAQADGPLLLRAERAALILATVAVIDALSRALRRGVLGEAGARRAV